MIRRPPRSTLSYTTLFRSRDISVHIERTIARIKENIMGHGWGQHTDPVGHWSRSFGGRGRSGPPPWLADLFGMGAPPDRKSTRLNSSHVEISYAVFCLKKK